MSNTLESGQALEIGQELRSENGRYQLKMQPDGNLVERRYGEDAVWQSGTEEEGYKAVMQGDGNFVVRSFHKKDLWDSGSGGHSGKNPHLVLQNDGNLCIYLKGAKESLWCNGAND